VKVAGRWRYVPRDRPVRPTHRRPRVDTPGGEARRFCQRAIGTIKATSVEVVTDRAPVYPLVLEELLPVAWHCTEQYANDQIEADHGRVKARLRPMRDLKQDRNAGVVIPGHAFVQNLRRGHYELAVEDQRTSG
jgi:transposase-like protein